MSLVVLALYAMFASALAVTGGLTMYGLLVHDWAYLLVGALGLVLTLTKLAPIVQDVEAAEAE